MKRRIKERNARIHLLGVVLLAVVFSLVVPALLASPDIGIPLFAMAALPFGFILRDPGHGEGGGGAPLTEEQFRSKVLGGVEALQKAIAKHDELMKSSGTDIIELKKSANDLQTQMIAFQRAQAEFKAQRRVLRPGEVSEECARHLGGIVLLAGLQRGAVKGDWAEGLVKDILGVNARSALTSNDIPLPTGYGAEVSELVSQYGAARQYGTVFPLGNGVISLPRLKTSPAFGLISASGTVTEVSPQTEWVTFTAEKFGGLVRLPSEIEEDSVFAMGQFLARYSAREMAKCEDTQFWIGTGAGSGANGTAAGLKALVTTNTKTHSWAGSAGKTAFSDSAIADFRAVRTKVDAAALRSSAYYMHPSFEQHLCSFNTSGAIYYQANGANGTATLDGFPIHWVDVMPAYVTTANAGVVFALFGDVSYMYLGVRGGIRFDTSREAGFTTDEILVRALERMTVGLMATGAVGGIKPPAN